MRLTAIAAAAAFALSVGGTGWAQTSNQPQSKGQQPSAQQGQPKGPAQPSQDKDDGRVQVFDDWRVRCEQPQGQAGERCVMLQSVMVRNEEGKQAPLLAVAIGHGEMNGQPITVMQFTVPLGLYLPSGIGLQVDNGQTVPIAIEVCTSQACVARYRLDDSMRVAMQKGQAAKLHMVRADRKQIDVPISLKGFTKAYAALK